MNERKTRSTLYLQLNLKRDTMKTAIKIDKSITKANSTTTTNSSEISKTGVTVVGFTAAIIGVWAVANLISGTINSGGPINLVSSLFKAISGY